MASTFPPLVDRLLSFGAVAVTVAAVALVVAELADGPDLPDIPTTHQPDVISDWKALFRSTDERYLVRVAIFSDYACPYSADVAHTMRVLQREYPDILVEYRSLPLRGELSETAAAIAECSRASGRFDEMHRTLFEFVDSLGLSPWVDIEASAGIVDTATFRNCAFGSEVPLGIEHDLDLAEKLGVTVTPSVMVDSLLFQGSPGPAYLESYVRRARWLSRTAGRSGDPS